ncbi:MAG TPA: cation:proton antiporter [Longimicrobiales bacterium]|nr:cation:proton antiporter [Longimicrobiales bacterium]
MQLNSAALTFALALAAGMTAQVLARHMRLPGIVILLVAGVLLGPDVANVVRPDTLGGGLRIIVGAAVAVILFEGGMHLDIGRLRREALTIRRLVTIGAAITGIGGAIAARYVMGWEWLVAVPFGALVIVTGPTVITPLLRRIRVNHKLHTILEAEGVLIDPIGAIIAVVALEVVLAQELGSAARGLIGIPTRLVLGAAMGAAGGFLMARLLAAERFIPEGLESVFTLSLVLAMYATCEAILSESGIMAAPIAGMVVGNMPSRPSRELKDFKEQLTVMLVGLLFILLAADVRIAEVTGLGWRGVWTVAVLMVVVRPLDVIVSTAGSELTLRERAFVAWLGPRGIVAAAIASLFATELAQEGIVAGIELRALVFLTIAATVLIQGIGGGPVAALLGVRRRSDAGYVIAGAHPLARALGRALLDAHEEVVLIDTDASEVAMAQRDGLSAIYGNVLDEETLQLADIESRRGIIGLIPNEGVSLLAAEKARREFRVSSAHVALRPRRSGVPVERLRAAGVRRLFGGETDIAYWSAELAAGRASLATYRYEGTVDREGAGALQPEAASGRALYLVHQHRGRTVPVDDQTRLRNGDTLVVLHAGRPVPPGPDFRPVEKPAEAHAVA